jgi:hypothetical protein
VPETLQLQELATLKADIDKGLADTSPRTPNPKIQTETVPAAPAAAEP